MSLSYEIANRIRSVVGTQQEFIPLHVPEFNGRERDLLIDCIDTGWVSSVGSYVDVFEKEVARVSDCEFGVVVSNGTAALQIALLVAGVSANDEVLIPALTFVATANAASHLGAVPHFVDSSYDTLGICSDRLRSHLEQTAEVRNGQTWNKQTGRCIAAIVPMHVFGCPVDMDGVKSLIAEWPMVIVEDAAESLGSSYKGSACGSLGRIAAVSFNGNKIITTGGGGAIVTNEFELAKRAKHLTTTAKQKHPWAFIHNEVAFNYRMPNLNAALGVAQLEQLGEKLLNKRRLFDAYLRAFDGVKGLSLFQPPKVSVSNNWLITLILDRQHSGQRNHLLESLNSAGIMVRPIWTLMHNLPMYRESPRADLSQAEDLEQRALNIPSSSGLGIKNWNLS